MVSSRQRGRQTELRGKKQLESEGWNVCLTDMPTKFKKSQDFFGCWDAICVKKGKFKLVQFKTNKWGDLRECKAFKEEYFYNHDFISCEAWKWNTKKKEWSVRVL